MSTTLSPRQAILLLDLTSLNDDDTDDTVRSLCQRAITPYGAVAAVCVMPAQVALAAQLLSDTPVRVASVANFPLGAADPEGAKKQTMQLIRDGADEVDVVFPWRNFLDADYDVCESLISGCKARCGNTHALKVILETGALGDESHVYRASRLAIEAGADFIKTSTGKTGQGATPEAARAMLSAIRDSGAVCGLKVSGGVRTFAQAASYISLAEELMGADWVSPANFRIGASALLGDLLARLNA
ncbi:deoxyribose-phosphate aldolase [Granulosicoccaceae sp. 1_MG-2023]|nr:deoxyribose-phosphate aldolase [Granulosicoccaceae sp. 1_MG-2023]